MAVVVPFPDRRRAVTIDQAIEREIEREIAQRELPRLCAVPDELEPEWDSGDSNAYRDRIEAGLEPED